MNEPGSENEPIYQTYYVNSTYSVAGPDPDQYGTHAQGLFENVGDEAVAEFKISVDPDDWRTGLVYVDQTSGSVTIAPKDSHYEYHRNGLYKTTLFGRDGDGNLAVVKQWFFKIEKRPKISVESYTRKAAAGSSQITNVTQRGIDSPLTVGEVFYFAPVDTLNATNAKDSDFKYVIALGSVPHMHACMCTSARVYLAQKFWRSWRLMQM